MNKNYILHLGILPMVLLKPKDLWRRAFDESDPRNPHFIYVNVLTRETVVHTESYNGKGTLPTIQPIIIHPNSNLHFYINGN